VGAVDSRHGVCVVCVAEPHQPHGWCGGGRHGVPSGAGRHPPAAGRHRRRDLRPPPRLSPPQRPQGTRTTAHAHNTTRPHTLHRTR
jgi:hypothetical protein